MRYNNAVKVLSLLLLFISTSLYAGDVKKSAYYTKVFKDFSRTKTHKIDDTIGEFKTNTKLLEVFNKEGKRIGFIREVSTSTGCNDGCLPVVFTLFYSAKAEFLRLISKPGLTKRDHEEFADLDYLQLESILKKNPVVFKKVAHPTEMVDAITRATLKIYQPHIIPRAAYTSLRTNLYNQQTLKIILKNFVSPRKK